MKRRGFCTRRTWATRTSSGGGADRTAATTRRRGRGRLTPRIHAGAGAVPHAADPLHAIRRRVEIDWAPLIASTSRRAKGPLASSWSTFAYSNSVSISSSPILACSRRWSSSRASGARLFSPAWPAARNWSRHCEARAAVIPNARDTDSRSSRAAAAAPSRACARPKTDPHGRARRPRPAPPIPQPASLHLDTPPARTLSHQVSKKTLGRRTLVLLLRLPSRLGRILAFTVVGFAVTVLYSLLNAPDLVLTQVLVEVLTTIVFVLAVRLAAHRTSGPSPARALQAVRLAFAMFVGVACAAAGVRGPSLAQGPHGCPATTSRSAQRRQRRTTWSTSC